MARVLLYRIFKAMTRHAKQKITVCIKCFYKYCGYNKGKYLYFKLAELKIQ